MNIRRPLALLACALVLLAPLARARAEAALLPDMSTSAIADAIDRYIDAHADTTAGVSIALARGGETLYRRAYGYADIAAARPVADDTVFEWGSATKLLVWTSVMQLVERGQLDLEADIRAYLPDGFLTKLAYERPITLRNLMHHDAGWEDVLVGLFVPPDAATQTLEQALRAGEPQQIYEPGTVCAYSNWGAALAGYIVERASGAASFADYVRDNIFAPLDMVHTALLPTLADNDWVRENRPLTQGYAGLTRIDGLRAIPLYPAGMATGTMGDFLRFAAALAPADGRTTALFETAGTLPAMLTPSLRYGDGGARNAHGFWSYDFASPVYGHGGNTAAHSAYLLIHPASHTALTIMTNQGNETVYNADLPALLFGRPTHVQQADMPDARDLRGVYRTTRLPMHGIAKLYGVVMTMPLLGGDENALSTTLFGNRLIAMNQSAPDVFTVDDRSAIQLIDIVHAQRMADGPAQLAMPYFGFLRIPTGQVIAEAIALLLLAAAIGYFAIALVVGGVRGATSRLRKKARRRSSMRRWHLAICALGLIEAANVVWMAVNLATYQAVSLFQINVAISWAFAAAIVGYTMLLAMRAHRWDCGGRERAMYIATAAMGLIVALNIAVWQWYRV